MKMKNVIAFSAILFALVISSDLAGFGAVGSATSGQTRPGSARMSPRHRRHARVRGHREKMYFLASSGIQRDQMGGRKGEVRSPVQRGVLTDDGSDRRGRSGPAKPGKLHRAGSFDGDLRELPMDAPQRRERPEREG